MAATIQDLVQAAKANGQAASQLVAQNPQVPGVTSGTVVTPTVPGSPNTSPQGVPQGR